MHRQGSNDSAGGLGAFGARNGQTVAPLVLRMPIVPAHPDDLHAMDFQQVQEDLPEVGVQGGGFVCFPPAILPPLDRPTLFDRVADILRIAAKRDGAGFFQALQRADHRHQLLAVVGGVRVAPADFFFYAVEAQDSPGRRRP